jgi:hypothetical protein
LKSIDAKGKQSMFAMRPFLTGLLLLTSTSLLTIAPPASVLKTNGRILAIQNAPQSRTDGAGHVCDDMGSNVHSMNVMGQSMAAMTNHMCITPLRPEQPGDEERAKALVKQVRAAIDKYQDYKKAIADGFIQGNPDVVQRQYHFTNNANVRLADMQFDPTRPSSLLYIQTPTQRFKLEGVMFTDSTSASEDELNQRIPLSIARWHEHTNFCAAPANKVNEYHGDHPKFGMFGSIHTAVECKAASGIAFYPVIFSWMIHVFPYEDNLKDQFSMNDDIPHVH